ncbi:MAG: hypothetical protein K8I82_21160 [Anaerolineae bacterium]|nr:hypothetical protein [Anaerolineae bacterium]
MPLPEHIQKLNQDILETIRQRSPHQSDVLLRKPLYKAFLELPDEPELRHKLVIKTARHIFHLVENDVEAEEEDKEIVRSLLEALTLNQDREAILSLHNMVYHASGNWEASLQFDAAVNAVYKAGSELLYGFFIPTDAEEENYRKWLDAPENVFPRVLVKDHDFAELAAMGDTAASAAVAFAVEEEAINEKKLLVFWEWWHQEAVPQSAG